MVGLTPIGRDDWDMVGLEGSHLKRNSSRERNDWFQLVFVIVTLGGYSNRCKPCEIKKARRFDD